MATLAEIPAVYHDTASGIPPDVLADLTLLEATARCVASERLKATGMAHSDPTAARATLQLSCEVLRVPPDGAADLRAKAAATSDPILRQGYFALADQTSTGHPRPSDMDRVIAQAALRPSVAKTARRIVTSGVSRRRLNAAVRSQVDAALAPSRARLRAVADEIAKTAQQRLEQPAMLYKAAPPANTEAARYRQLAAEVLDPQAARGYLELADRAERTGR